MAIWACRSALAAACTAAAVGSTTGTVVGAWISADRARNEREIEALIQLAKDGQVDIAVVGNEVLLRGDLPEQELLECIARVKAAAPDGNTLMMFVDDVIRINLDVIFSSFDYDCTCLFIELIFFIIFRFFI